MWIKSTSLPVLLLAIINYVKCFELTSIVDPDKITSEDARMFGSIVGIIVENIDWLPIEINVIDVIRGFLGVISRIFLSTTSTVQSMVG